MLEILQNLQYFQQSGRSNLTEALPLSLSSDPANPSSFVAKLCAYLFLSCLCAEDNLGDAPHSVNKKQM